VGNIRLRNPPANIHLLLHLDIFKGLPPEPLLAQGPPAPGHGTRGRALREDAVDARLAHLVVAFGVDEEAHVRVQVARRFAYWANVWGEWVSRVFGW